jgi:hypothetical protein
MKLEQEPPGVVVLYNASENLVEGEPKDLLAEQGVIACAQAIAEALQKAGIFEEARITWRCIFWKLQGGTLMPTIESALDIDGPSILRMTATTGIFTPTELSCVEELWNAYQHRREASGYAFWVYCEDG